MDRAWSDGLALHHHFPSHFLIIHIPSLSHHISLTTYDSRADIFIVFSEISRGSMKRPSVDRSKELAHHHRHISSSSVSPLYYWALFLCNSFPFFLIPPRLCFSWARDCTFRLSEWVDGSSVAFGTRIIFNAAVRLAGRWHYKYMSAVVLLNKPGTYLYVL